MTETGPYPRIMGLDYGSKTVGVAVTDPLSGTAQGVETVWRERESKMRRTLARIAQIADEYSVSEIVVGLPLNMDGTEGERARMARAFGESVARRTSLPVSFEDERLTTVEADAIMQQRGIAREHRKEHIDTLCAMLILESYCSHEHLSVM